MNKPGPGIGISITLVFINLGFLASNRASAGRLGGAMAMAVAMARPTGIRAAHTQLYEVLKVDKAATPAQLKSAYRNLAKDYHPDVSSHPDAQARFVELSGAYEVPKALYFLILTSYLVFWLAMWSR